MIDQKVRSKYKATIGIECHVQLKTKTKLFAGVGNDAREAAPNTLVSHICFGLPGALPVLNEDAVKLACKAALALGTEAQKFSKFDRKHYFYPDLPMGYQISQYDEPIILGGEVKISVDGQEKTIGITRAHLEADAGKSVHHEGQDYSLVDLNRAGTPLLEIVSEPDMHTSAEAKAYARELYLLMRFADVSDANLYYGNMRFDVNVSVSKSDQLGTRTETKNLNSFKSVEKTVDYEIKRQIEVLEKGGVIHQETRGWNDAKQTTFLQRSKENADDYRYMPDPDLPPIVLTDKELSDYRDHIPVLPNQWRDKLRQVGLDEAHIETVIDGELDYGAGFLQLVTQDGLDKKQAKTYANWVVNIEIPYYRDKQESSVEIQIDIKKRDSVYESVYKLYMAGKLNSNRANDLIIELLGADKIPGNIEEYAHQKGYIQVSDAGEIEKIADQVISENPKAVEDIKSGEAKAIGFLVGQVMKLSKGQANPSMAQELLQKKILG